MTKKNQKPTSEQIKNYAKRIDNGQHGSTSKARHDRRVLKAAERMLTTDLREKLVKTADLKEKLVKQQGEIPQEEEKEQFQDEEMQENPSLVQIVLAVDDSGQTMTREVSMSLAKSETTQEKRDISEPVLAISETLREIALAQNSRGEDRAHEEQEKSLAWLEDLVDLQVTFENDLDD